MANISAIKLPDNSNYDLRASAIPFGIVDSSSTSTAFTVTVPGITALEDGAICMLKNGVVTSASGFTINVNGLGAKPVYSNMAAATADTTIFNVNYTMIFVYDETRVEGGCWICYRGYNSNDNTIGYQIRTGSSSLPVNGATGRYRILFTSPDGTHFVPPTLNTSTNATSKRDVNTAKIDPFGRIVYYSTTTILSAEDRPGTGSLWQQYTLALGYSFNRTGAALTMTLWKPVFVKCAPQSDGSAIIDADTPYVQDLPSTADGKIYILLGIAYSATNIELTLEHPVFQYKNGGIRQYSSAVPTNTGNSTTGISIAAHGTGTITGVQSSTTSVRGVKTNTLNTASHVKSGGNGTAPTLGTDISLTGVQASTTSVRGVKTGTNSTTTASKATLGTAFSIPNPSATNVTVPIRADADVTVPVAASSATTVPIKATSATTVPIKNSSTTDVPVVSSNADATLSFTMDTTDTKKLKISWSATPTRTVFGTAVSIYGVQSSTTSVTGVQSSTTSVTGVSGSTTVRGVKTGTDSTTTASKVSFGTDFTVPNPSFTDVTVPIRADSDVTVPIKNTSATSIPNVTSVGSASNWVFEDVSVPIPADADTTVPIKNTSATTVVTGTTHTITDTGHTHTV